MSVNIKKQILEAVKAKDSLRASTLRMLSAELQKAEINKRPGKLTQEDELKVAKAEAKKRKDAIEAFEKAGRNELAKKEQQELEILQEFLPEEMSEDALEKIVDDSIEQTKADSIKDMGKVMSAAMSKAQGKVDGGRVSELVKKKLS